jgi:alpha-tubulin suppressor-like RCC1 family protein
MSKNKFDLFSLFVLLFLFVFVVDANAGTVTAWGYNGYGQLGNGTNVSTSKSVTVALPQSVFASAIEAGSFHSLAVTNDGLYFWGSGTTSVPSRVIFPPSVTLITAAAAGGGHSLALTNDGVYAWGNNGSGQLGDGSNIQKISPVKVHFPLTVWTVYSIAAGEYHSLAITNDGVYAWGAGESGQLGNYTRSDSNVPVKAHLPGTATTVLSISGGGFHSLAITNDGLYAWGNNTFGQLGNGTKIGSSVPVKTTFPRTVTNVVAISAGFWHSMAIANNGLYAFGDNSSCVLGTQSGSTALPYLVKFPKGVSVVKAVATGSSHTIVNTNNGIYGWGRNSEGQLGTSGKTKGVVCAPARNASESGVVALSAGYYHSLALH